MHEFFKKADYQTLLKQNKQTKPWYICTMRGYLTIKRKNSLIHLTPHQCWKLGCWQTRPSPWRPLQTLPRDGVCFNLLRAFLSLPRTGRQRCACENCPCFRHHGPSAVFLKPWKRKGEKTRCDGKVNSWWWPVALDTVEGAWNCGLMPCGRLGLGPFPLMTAAHDAGRVFT